MRNVKGTMYDMYINMFVCVQYVLSECYVFDVYVMYAKCKIYCGLETILHTLIKI